jgi:hypothetical protein
VRCVCGFRVLPPPSLRPLPCPPLSPLCPPLASRYRWRTPGGTSARSQCKVSCTAYDEYWQVRLSVLASRVKWAHALAGLSVSAPVAVCAGRVRVQTAPVYLCRGIRKHAHAYTRGVPDTRCVARPANCSLPTFSAGLFVSLRLAHRPICIFVYLLISSELSRSSAPALHWSPRSPTRADLPGV